MAKTLKDTRTTKTKAVRATTRTAPPKILTSKRAPRPSSKAAAATKTPNVSKQAQLIALLRSPGGATIEQMTRTTGWQAHTVRGTISGALRRRQGLNVICVGDAGARVYRIVAGT